MHLHIRYVNRFVYPQPVWDSYNVLRACPATSPTQQLLDYRLEVTPTARVVSYLDAWGTRVDSFGIRQPHQELLVVAEAEVETQPPPQPEESPPLDSVREWGFREEHWMFLQPTRHTRWDGELEASARQAVADFDDLLEATGAISAFIHETLEYRPGATTVGVDVTEVWRDRKGVCQDFVHVGLAMYRAVGVPARYVSGYFYAADPSAPDAPPEGEIVVQTHAWLEVAVPGFGWWGLDPTNALPAGERHVKIGHGRDYDDVLPLRGVYYGEVGHDLAVEVEMTSRTLPVFRVPEVGPGADQ